jgi:lipopolysaccharide transport system permease protein
MSVHYEHACRDIVEGLSHRYVWSSLAGQDIRQRYRRSVIGPFWVTLSMGLMIVGMGYLYSQLFGHPLTEYMPFLTVGLVVWGLINALANEGCQTFISAEAIIKQIRLPLTVHVWRTVWRNLIVFGHNAVVIVLVLAVFRPHLRWDVLLLPLAVVVLMVNGWWVCVVLGIMSARYRDIPQLAASLLQVLFFLTPVIWKTDTIGDRIWLANSNPAYHLIEIVRAPLIGQPMPFFSWMFATAFTALGSAVAFLLLARFRARIPYWL